jgi:starch phosphorylase
VTLVLEREPQIAYFTMEIALAGTIPTYAGGLGVLAGDTMRTAADLALPMIAVSLVSRRGYFRQQLDAAGRQIEQPDPWEPAQWATPLEAKVAVTIEGRTVWVGGWLYRLESHRGEFAPVILLDTDLADNTPDDRGITHFLYGGDDAYRLKQEVVLGIGGVRLLQALGLRIRQYHLNEGHSALLAVELLRSRRHPPENLRPGDCPYDIPDVRALCNFTTHTPVDAGHDRFSYDLVARTLGDVIEPKILKDLAGADALNMTQLALNLSEYVNGVAERHAEISRRMFPGYRVRAITNGVHPATWTAPEFTRLYDQYLPGWAHEPELLLRADRIPGDAIWQAHRAAKAALLDEVARRSGVALDPDRPIIGFARRMTAYKRPDLLFSDPARLRALAVGQPFQILIAGKAHPRDADGKRLIGLLVAHLRALRDQIPGAFLPNYDLPLAQRLVAGVDIWLNTPLRPLEASGTSGMKAALNGVPHLSVLDGWWVEGHLEGVTGWAIGGAGEEANGGDGAALYEALERRVLPAWRDRAGWIGLMQSVICKSGSVFTSHRMMRRYATEAYLS